MAANYRRADLLFFRSRKPQAAYQTATTPSATAPTPHVRLYAKTDGSDFQYAPVLTVDENIATGSEFPDQADQYISRWNASANISQSLDVLEVAQALYMHLGAISTTVLEAGISFEHTISRLAPSVGLQLPVYEYGRYIDDPINERFLSMASRSLRFATTEQAGQRLTMDQDLVGSGRVINPSGLIYASGVTQNVAQRASRTMLTTSDVRLFIGNSDGSVTTYTTDNNIAAVPGQAAQHDCTLRSWEVTLTNEFAEDASICPGAPVYRYSGIGSAFAATTAIVKDAYVEEADRLYVVTVAGTTGAAAPTHTTGTAVNGTATFKFLGYVSESGAVSGELLRTRSTFEVGFRLRVKATSTIFEDLASQRALDLQIGARGGKITGSTAPYYNSMMLRFWLAKYQTANVVFSNDGFAEFDCRATIFNDAVSGNVLTAKVRNSSPASEYV